MNIWKKRLSAVIYGLIYPAFLGNMIYDIILAKRTYSNEILNYPDYFTCFVIILFSAIDYMHLYGDMNDIIPPNRRSWIYIACDVFMPIFLFLAFVFIKEKSYQYGIILIGILPILLLFYKYKNKPSRKIFIFYSCISLIFAILLIKSKFKYTNELIFYFVTISLFIYLIYIIFIYPKKPKEFDIEYIHKNSNEDY